MKKVGIAFHPLNVRAPDLTRKLESVLKASGVEYWTSSAWDDDALAPHFPGTDFILTVGGDGTILRVAHTLDGAHIPIVGVNVGVLGFLTEIQPSEIDTKLEALLSGEGRVEARAMLEAALVQTVNGKKQSCRFTSLNDVVMARGAIARIIDVTATVDGAVVDTYKADGALVATATGSTGYALAAGGPILNPQSPDILLVPILPHLSMAHPLVLTPRSVVNLSLASNHGGTLSIDGHTSVDLFDGASVTVKASSKHTRFLRVGPPGDFYASLGRRLRG